MEQMEIYYGVVLIFALIQGVGRTIGGLSTKPPQGEAQEGTDAGGPCG